MLSRKTLALISSLIIVLIALFVLSFSATNQVNKSAPSIPQPTPTPIAQTVIKMSPNPVVLTNGKGSVEVNMDTNENEISAVQLEILYDPQALSNVAIKLGTFFSSTVPYWNKIDKEKGIISYSLVILPNEAQLKGSGTVAVIEFQKNPSSSIASTELEILPRTIVVTSGNSSSVLNQAIGTTVLLTENTQ